MNALVPVLSAALVALLVTSVVLRRRRLAALGPDHRPRWARKRWWLATAAVLLVAYPLSVGPTAYCHGRGWCPDALLEAAYAPLILAVRPFPGVTRTLQDYVMRWHQLGHAT